MSQYSTRHLIEMYGVSHATVKAWSAEFAHFLSPTATPPAGQRRLFTDDDLRVFALVADYKERGLKFADIHAALASGERGDLAAPNAIEALPPAAKDLIVRLKDELDAVRAELGAERQKTSKAAGQVELLREQITELQADIRDLNRIIGKLEG